MTKLDMQTKSVTDSNVDYIESRFPNAVTEVEDKNGKLVKKVDFDILKQELSNDYVEGKDERYSFSWPGKNDSILLSNRRTNKTLRPCRETSVDFDNTQNLYIEGDNLDVLKLLTETYLGKIRMIYIDPPYNTGDDRIYKDNFYKSYDEYLKATGQIDEEGNKMVENLESGGRYHSDWLTMMYSRLKLAKNLLTEDGFIIISIDDNELFNLKKICDDVFGERQFVNNITIKMSELSGVKMRSVKKYAKLKESALLYAKNIDKFDIKIEKKTKSDLELDKYLKYYSNVIVNKEDDVSKWKIVPLKEYLPKMDDMSSEDLKKWKLEHSDILVYRTNSKTINKYVQKHPSSQDIEKLINADGKEVIRWGDKEMLFLSSYTEEYTGDIWMDISTINLNKEAESVVFEDGQKPLSLIRRFISSVPENDFTLLDFFSGSATTAHATMQLNAEDGGHRKFIMVQIPEKCAENSDAYKAGYKNICEIGEERIRRAGKKIVEENPSVKDTLDTGFRVLKLDSSNMKDVYYNPSAYTQDLLASVEDNIKEDRTPLDLVFQVMLDLGITLDSKIEEKTVNGKKVFIVREDLNETEPNLVCCFDSNIDNDTVIEIAKLKPEHAVFRDSSMSSDSVFINVDQIFESYSPNTDKKVI